jgi:ankyrin repeat protein
MRKVYILLILFISICYSANSQKVITIDSTQFARLVEILKDYNSHNIYIDTSDFVENVPDELNINLQTAAFNGFCGEIIRLLKNGANINSMSPEKVTPLLFAVSSGHKDAAEILLILGGDPNTVDDLKKTPIIVATENDDIEMAELLIKYGADTSVGDFLGLTPLHYAVKNESFYMVDMLLYYNVNPDTRDKKGETPLVYSVLKSNCEIADLLLHAGANPNISDKNGFTPFMYAAQNGDTLMLKLLHDAGADIYAVNQYGYDAYSLALMSKQNDAVRFLKSLGNLWFEKKPGKVDPNIIALEFGVKEGLSKGYTIPLAQKLSVNMTSLSAGCITTNHLVLLTGEVSLRAPMIRSGVFAEYTFTPGNSRVLVNSGSTIYQYFVASRTIEAGIFHDWNIGGDAMSGNFKFYSALSGGYKSYSKYSGSIMKPANQFCIIPSAGVTYSFRSLGMSAEIKYMKTPFYKMADVWFGAKLFVNIYSGKNEIPGIHKNNRSNE